MKPPIHFAILGCGGYAGYHARRLAEHPDVRLTALCDLHESIVGDFVDQHLPSADPPRIFTDLAQMLADAKPHAILIATPHTLHFAHASTALDAGCHVYLEKPMVTRAADARKLAAKVKQTNRTLVVGYNTPCTPEFAYLRHTIENPHSPTGLGELQLVNAYLSQNWRHWTTGKWRQEPTLAGGGFAYDTGAHVLASLCYSINQPVADVFALIDTRGTKVDINSVITVRFTTGVLANLTFAGDCPSDACRMHYLFAGGRIEIDGWYGHHIDIHNAFGRVKYPRINTDLPGQHPLDNFIDALLGRDEPRTGPELGIIQSELMDAIYESAKRGKVVRVREVG